MQDDLALALRLQALDRKIATLETGIATLPKHIAEIEKHLEAHTHKLEADRTALASNQRERKKTDGDIQLHQQKISKLRDQMAAAKTNEHYKAFQNEINFIEGEVRKCEDRILELMEQAEPLDANVKTAESALKTEQKQVESEKIRARDRSASETKELTLQQTDRKAVSELMSPVFYKEYERIRKKSKNRPIADATDGRCSACQISLRPQLFQDLRKGDTVMYCESCGRILTYNPAVDLTANADASKQIA